MTSKSFSPRYHLVQQAYLHFIAFGFLCLTDTAASFYFIFFYKLKVCCKSSLSKSIDAFSPSRLR